MIKSFKIFEKFKSLNLVETFSWLDESSKPKFISLLQSMCYDIDIPLSELRDENFSYMNTNEALDSPKAGDHNFWFKENKKDITYTITNFKYLKIEEIKNGETFFMLIYSGRFPDLIKEMDKWVKIKKIDHNLIQTDKEINDYSLKFIELKNDKFIYKIDQNLLYNITFFKEDELEENYVVENFNFKNSDFCIKYRPNFINSENKLSDIISKRDSLKPTEKDSIYKRLVKRLDDKSFERMIRETYVDRKGVISENIYKFVTVVLNILDIRKDINSVFNAFNYKLVRKGIAELKSFEKIPHDSVSLKIEKWLDSLDFNDPKTFDKIEIEFSRILTNYYRDNYLLEETEIDAL